MEFDKIRSDSELLECSNCKNIRNVSAFAEDVKHEQYHMYDEPDDKPMRDPV